MKRPSLRRGADAAGLLVPPEEQIVKKRTGKKSRRKEEELPPEDEPTDERAAIPREVIVRGAGRPASVFPPKETRCRSAFVPGGWAISW